MRINCFLTVKRYFILELNYLKMNLIAVSKYKISYFLSILYELMNGVMNVVFLYVMFNHINTLAGWSKEDVLLLVAIGYFIDVTCVMLFIGVISIPEYILNGTMDVFLTKPVNPKFLLSFRRPNSVQILNVIISLLFLSSIIYTRKPEIVAILLFGISMVCSIVIMYLLMSSIVYLSFWTVKIGNTWQIIEQFNSISNKPAEIYPRAVRAVMTFIIPSLVMINFPARIIVYADYSILLTHTFPITIVLYVINCIIFKQGIKHYSGAGG